MPPNQTDRHRHRDLPSSLNRTEEWHKLCHTASLLMGTTSTSSGSSASFRASSTTPVINLLPSSFSSSTSEEDQLLLFNLSDFDRSAYELKYSIVKMSELLQREILKDNEAEYDGDGDDTHEVVAFSSSSSMQLETTVASFVARTANQVERMRTSIIHVPSSANDTSAAGANLFYRSKYNESVASHRSGVVAYLLLLLREDIVGVLNGMQRRRKEREKEREKLRKLRQEFEFSFDEDPDPLLLSVSKSSIKLPAAKAPIGTLLEKTKYKDRELEAKQSSLPGEINHIELAQKNIMDENDKQMMEHNDQQLAIELVQQEPNSALTDIKAVEQKIIEITTLFSQFSTLVSDQQEDVIAVYTNTNQTKDNMTKGQEQLIDAEERITKSRHRMAKFIVGIGIVLFFLNLVIK